MKVVVIGGSAAGLKAACRIARLKPSAQVSVLVKDRYFGYSGCGLPYFLSGEVAEFSDILRTPNGTLKDEKYFREVKGVDVYARHEVYEIDRSARRVNCRNLVEVTETSFPYDKLVIATGSVPAVPSIPGLNNSGVSYFSKLEDAVQIHDDLTKGKIGSVVIIGAGFTGIELCESFRSLWGVDVTLVENKDQILPGMLDRELSRLVEVELGKHEVKLHLDCGSPRISVDEGMLILSDSSGMRFRSDRIIIAAGAQPNVSLAHHAGLEIGNKGGIRVDDRLLTSDPDIYAAGDCVECRSSVNASISFQQSGSLATRMGRIVADNICGRGLPFGSIAGATILKVFDLSVGSVGFSAKRCRERGIDNSGCWGTFYDRMPYYPEAKKMHLCLIYKSDSGKILGLQAVSDGQIHNVIDRGSQLINMGFTIPSIKNLEHSYSPPYAQPLDPLHYLSFIAENCGHTGIELVSPAETDTISPDTVILDVRDPEEIDSTPVDFTPLTQITIPLLELRSRLGELPAGSPLMTICQMGGRSWDAALILRQAGWKDVRFLAGGVLFLPQREIHKTNGIGTSVHSKRLELN